MVSEFIKKRRSKKEEKSKKGKIPNEEREDLTLLKKNVVLKNGDKKIIRVTKDGNILAKYEELQEKPEKSKFKTIVIEQDESFDFELSDLEDNKSLVVPLNVKEEIEKFILKILFEEKSVKSSKVLTEKVLERAIHERKTISEKAIQLIIYQLNKEQKIQYTQKDGWKIRI